MKAHYLMYLFDDDTQNGRRTPSYKYDCLLIKMRGFHYVLRIRSLPESTFDQDPLFYLLKAILEGLEDTFKIKNLGVYYKTKLLKKNSWVLSLPIGSRKRIIKQEADGQTFVNIDTSNSTMCYSTYGEHLLPGDEIVNQSFFRLSNSYMPIDDYAELLRKTRRGYRVIIYKKLNQQFKQRLFEKYFEDYYVVRFKIRNPANVKR
jgi:hypothetical protein